MAWGVQELQVPPAEECVCHRRTAESQEVVGSLAVALAGNLDE